MRLADSIWTSLTYVTSLLTLSPVKGPIAQDQALLLVSHDTPHQAELVGSKSATHAKDLKGPIFKPPSGSLHGDGSDFVCDYSNMIGYEQCSDADDRTCWLKNPTTHDVIDINTDYENTTLTPIGIHRKYTMYLDKGTVNADGIDFDDAKIFNDQYPGPWVQACWGDTVSVKVINLHPYNGTSVHWHGIRQLKTMHMDGVNGITQCPIAPGDTYTYTFNVTQYGSAWYHSHYSVQYADGAAGPLTLHGPTSSPYDEAKDPILMTEWAHNSAFDTVSTFAYDRPSILLNGTGDVTHFNNQTVNTTNIPSPYSIKFDPPPSEGLGRAKRYLLRLINTSFASTFIFSIDNHTLEVVGADFVPIQNYTTDKVLVGIGQRYHVIVTAIDQKDNPENYWIRTWITCQEYVPGTLHYEQTGIVYYGDTPGTPGTSPWPDINSTLCADEPYESLVPVVPKDVCPPGGIKDICPPSHAEDLTLQFKLDPDVFPLAQFSLAGPEFNPLRVDYGDPTFLNLNFTGKWPPSLVMYPENYTDTTYVYLAINGLGGTTFGAHPLHLHGHDFAILQINEVDNFPEGLNLTFKNPPRRDVVLLPSDGYVVIAFPTDNPGAWLLHCHIAFHASMGLGMQIMERQDDAKVIWPSHNKSAAIQEVQRGCNNWNKWWGDCKNWWDSGDGSSCFQGKFEFAPDSGI